MPYFNFRVSSPPLSSFSEKRKSFQSGFREFWDKSLWERIAKSLREKSWLTTDLFDLWRAQHLKAASRRRSDEFIVSAPLYEVAWKFYLDMTTYGSETPGPQSLSLRLRAPRPRPTFALLIVNSEMFCLILIICTLLSWSLTALGGQSLELA